MKIRNYLFILALSPVIWSCGDQKPTESDPSGTSGTEVRDPDTGPENTGSDDVRTKTDLSIEGIYATSTALPFKKYHVLHVFDGNESTGWKTIPGAGPDEGIMIHLENETYIERMEIVQNSGDEFARVNAFEIYGNGREFGDGKDISMELSNLYIRVGKTAETTENKFGSDQESSKVFAFDPTRSVGISEIKLYGKDNRQLSVGVPQVVSGTILASSTLTPESAYSASNLMDCMKETGWAENVKGTGTGESVTINLGEEISLSQVKIWNGYQRSEQHFEGNARAKTLNIEGSTVNLADESGEQYFELEKVANGKSITIKVVEAYPGKKYEDLVLSEIKLYNNGVPVLFADSKKEEEIRKNLELKASNAVLARIMDKNIHVVTSRQEQADGVLSEGNTDQSINIRSNNTFVIYQSENEMEQVEDEGEFGTAEENKETIADGGWELMETGKDQVKIRIFGRIYTSREKVVYSGGSESESQKIFQDFLTINLKEIQGQKFIKNIRFAE